MENTGFLMGFSEGFKALYMSTDTRLLDLEGIAPDYINVPKMAYRYCYENAADMSVDTNANRNEGKSYCGYLHEVASGWLKLQGYYDMYLKMSDMYGEKHAAESMRAVWAGDMYIHDSTAIHAPYCWAASTSMLLDRGTPWGQLHSLPARRRHSFIDQVKELTIEIAQNIAGAVALGDLFVNYTYFVKQESLDIHDPVHRKSIENDFQSLVHTLNKKLRPSHQSPFTNLSIFDRPNLAYLFDEMRYPDGSKPDLELVYEVQKIFCEWFKQGDPVSGLPYRFPVVTLNLRIGKAREILDQEAFAYFSAINLEKAAFNIYISSGNKIASCCRLVNDLDMAGTDSFGNGGISLGSHRVVTINLARIGFKAQSFDQAIKLLLVALNQARDILVAHRALLAEGIKRGFLHLFTHNVMHLSRFFSTFGINGLYECLEELGTPITTEQGRLRAHEILNLIKEFSYQCSRETGTMFNVEQVPAESLAIKFAQKDTLLYGMHYSLYANQFIPLWVNADVVDRIKLDGEFSRVLTGGGISHVNIGEKLTSIDQMQQLIMYTIACGCEHFAVNYNFCMCVNNHVSIAGQSKRCPLCAAAIKDQYTRIVGYYTPVSSWNKGRRQEHGRRIFAKPDTLPGSSQNKPPHDPTLCVSQHQHAAQEKSLSSDC